VRIVVIALLAVGACVAQELPEYSIKIGDRTRTYLLYAPPNVPAGKKLALVLALHGGGGNADSVKTDSRFHELAAKRGFLVAFPNGYEHNWNDGRGIPDWPAHRENVDDVGFLSALIDHLVATRNADPRRVFATGISNGGLMSLRLGCELAGKIAAIAPVARTMPVKMAEGCRPSQPMPVIFFLGAADPLVPFAGGDQVIRSHRTPTLSGAATGEKWARLNGCGMTPTRAEVPEAADPSQGMTVRREVYSGCKSGAEVVAYVLEGAGHTWPGGHARLTEAQVGKVNPKLNATEIIWEFFERHARK
jgi:polyhydroxybutyrate depolymerase